MGTGGDGGSTAVALTLTGATFEESDVNIPVALVGTAHQGRRDVPETLNYTLEGDVNSYDFTFNLQNQMMANVSKPYPVMMVNAETVMIDHVYLSGEAFLEDLVTLSSLIIESDAPGVANINNILNAHGMGYISNFSLEGTSTIMDYVVNSNIAEYAVSLSIPISVLGNASYMTAAGFYMDATVNNSSITIEANVLDDSDIDYKVAHIDHGLAAGRIDIRPNGWTLCYANEPINDDGTEHTISSFLISKLKDKYGDDILSSISMIVSRHPETGEEYNFVVSDAYITPSGSFNDFKISYQRDGVFYPVPFMVQSSSSEVLSIEWDPKG
jgi:hypothetical protein